MRFLFSIYFFLFSCYLFSQQYFHHSQKALKERLCKNIQQNFRHQNPSAFFSQYEILEFHLKTIPYLQESEFIYEVMDVLPFEMYEKYYLNRIQLISLYGYVDFSIDLKNHKKQLVGFSIPLEKLDFLNPNVWLKSIYPNSNTKQ